MHERTTPSDGTVERIGPALVGDPSRDDLLLAVIPLAFVVATLAGAVGPASFTAAMRAAALVGALVVVDALFVNPPGTSGSR